MKTIFSVIFSILAISSVTHGMFEAILMTFEVGIKDSPILNCDEMKVKRFNRTTFVLAGNCKLYAESVDDWIAVCEVFKKMGNAYKVLPYKIGPAKVCDMLKDEKMIYPDIVAHAENLPPAGTCDFKPATIYINNWLPDLSNVPPVFESGDYGVECSATRNGELMQTLKVYGQVYNIKDAKPKMGF